jgi:hypothetical protein
MATRETINIHSTQEELDQAIRNEFNPPPPDGTLVGSGTIGGRKLPGIDGTVGVMGIRVDERDRQDLAFRVYGSPSDSEDFTARDHYFARPDGELLVELQGDPLLADRPDEVAVEAWFVDNAGRARFLGRPAAGARTTQDLDAIQAEAQRRAEADDKARDKWLRNQPQRPLTLNDLDGGARPTLRTAVRTLIEHGGQVKLGAHGEVECTVPELFIWNRDDNIMVGAEEQAAVEACAQAAELIVRAAPVVTEALRSIKRGQSLIDAVPDRPVTLAGGVA